MTTTKNKVHPSVAAASVAVRDLITYFTRYVTFSDPQYPFALALWTFATYLWPHFDAFPYLVITSDTKRSGKTRLSELLSFAASNARSVAGVTPATIFRMIRDENPTLIIDEAETLSSEAADTMRSILNVGYRRGQVIPRAAKGEAGIIEWPAYCPKVFILIGDPFDTLRDRSILIRMKRGAAPQRFLYETAKAEGNAIGERMAELAATFKDAVLDVYGNPEGLAFLTDRDEEIWMPIFSLASVACPDRLTELTRAAVDMATEKTADTRKHTNVDMKAAEEEATQHEYAERLLRDFGAVMGSHRYLTTADALRLLHELPTGPWRKFRGEGLSAIALSDLLRTFNVVPRVIRTKQGKRTKQAFARGYRREDVTKALAQFD